MIHIENLTIHAAQGQSAISRAFIEALLRGPEFNEPPEPEESAPTTSEVATKAPKIGEYWPGQGGIYAGIASGRDGDPDYHLILASEAPDRDFKWQAALDYAKTVTADGHSDFTVPTRFESALLYANVQDQLNKDNWHWTSTQCSEISAWGQLFNYGAQNYGKDYERRCRFVRRLVL